MRAWFGLVAVITLQGAQEPRAPYQGITIFERGPARIVRIDLDTPGLRLALSPPGGTREAVRETTLRFLERTGAQLAVNGHFFEPFPSQDAECYLIGLAVANGVKYSDFEEPRQSYAIVANAPALVIGEGNRASIAGKGDTMEAQLAISGSAQVITKGQVTIPEYGTALRSGGAAGYGPGKSWYGVKTSRTLIGLTADRRTLLLLTAEKMTVAEAASLLASGFGASDALNLDGGGSTSLVVRDPETGKPEVLAGTGRAVCSSLAVFAPAGRSRTVIAR